MGQHWQAMRPGTKAPPLAAAKFAIAVPIPAAADASADQAPMIRAEKGRTVLDWAPDIH